MKTSDNSRHGMTLLELAVVIVVLVGLGAIALPLFSEKHVLYAHTRALSHAKQIALACKIYAGDYGGYFPPCVLDATGKPTQLSPTTSNEAFAVLIPDYLPDESFFWLPLDKFYCSNSRPSEKPGPNPQKLAAGANHWGYVTNLNENSDPRFPLIADGTAPGRTSYNTTEGAAGAAWKGRKVIVIRVDASGQIENIDNKTLTIPGPTSDIPDLLQNNQKGWLGPDNVFVNPIPAPAGS